MGIGAGKPDGKGNRSGKSGGKSGGSGVSSIQRNNSAPSLSRAKSFNGPRTPNNASLVGNTSGIEIEVIADMQRRVQKMQEEMTKLRAAVVMPSVAPLISLSYDEKKALVEDIQALSSSDLGRVITIIQAGCDHERDGDSDEVEIPMDELDVATLRKLQEYVMRVKESKNKPKNYSKETVLKISKKRSAETSEVTQDIDVKRVKVEKESADGTPGQGNNQL